MANTIIQIKRSQSSAAPGSLNYGELAYSFDSGRFFIGNISNVPIAIGGNTYNQIVDTATSSNTNNSLVQRDAYGSFSATSIYAELFGNASTASQWKTARLLGVDGDATGQVSVDGTADANIQLTLVNSGVSAATYGGTSSVPIFTVNEKGIITSAANTTISTDLNIIGDSGDDTVNLLTDILKFEGGDGITSSVSTNNVTFGVDATVIRTSGDQQKIGDFTIIGNLNVSGNTIFTGNTSYIDIEHYKVADPLIYLAANNYISDIVAIGFAANYFDGSNELHTGLFRLPQSNNYYLFTGVTDELSANNEITPSANGFMIANLVASITQANVSNLLTAISVTDGGTGLRALANGDILFATAEDTLGTLTKTSSGSVLLSGDHPSWGKVALDSAVSNVLPVANGGTNVSNIGSAGSIAYSNGSSYLFTTTGSSGQALISGGISSPTFGTLDLLGGGLGFTTPNANSAVFYAGTGNSMSYTNTASDGQVLQFGVSTGIQFGHLDGGAF